MHPLPTMFSNSCVIGYLILITAWLVSLLVNSCVYHLSCVFKFPCFYCVYHLSCVFKFPCFYWIFNLDNDLVNSCVYHLSCIFKVFMLLRSINGVLHRISRVWFPFSDERILVLWTCHLAWTSHIEFDILHNNRCAKA